MAGNFIIVSPYLQPNRITEDEIKNKKLSKEISARTTADSSTKADDMHVSPAIAKPNVAGLCHLRYNLLVILCPPKTAADK